LQQLVNYLNGLHQSFQKTVVDDELENTRNAKAELHIFEYPFREENGFDLDTVQEGLQASDAL
jgi:5-methylthioribose kinase